MREGRVVQVATPDELWAARPTRTSPASSGSRTSWTARSTRPEAVRVARATGAGGRDHRARGRVGAVVRSRVQLDDGPPLEAASTAVEHRRRAIGSTSRSTRRGSCRSMIRRRVDRARDASRACSSATPSAVRRSRARRRGLGSEQPRRDGRGGVRGRVAAVEPSWRCATRGHEARASSASTSTRRARGAHRLRDPLTLQRSQRTSSARGGLGARGSSPRSSADRAPRPHGHVRDDVTSSGMPNDMRSSAAASERHAGEPAPQALVDRGQQEQHERSAGVDVPERAPASRSPRRRRACPPG